MAQSRIYIKDRPLPGEWDVYGGPDDGMRLKMTGTQPYPGPRRVNYTPEEWEREVNACADYVRNSTRLPSKATYRAFVEHQQDEHAYYQRQLQGRVERCIERGDDLGVQIYREYVSEYEPPRGACYWSDGWQCVSHAEMMEADDATS